MESIENELNYNSDEEVSTKSHSRLIDAISKLDKTQHVKKPTRTEPSLQISEFNLVKGRSKRVNVKDLTSGLKKKGVNNASEKKVKLVNVKGNTLRKPLEKIQAQKIKRSVGFDNVKKSLDRWEPIVATNRAAEQLRFPLQQPEKLKWKTATDEFVNRFTIKSDLQKKLEALEPPKKQKAQKQKFPLSLKEIMAYRKESAKLRAQQSYREAKARRQSKIKSKKYHRIQKREKVKQQIKDFEALQKTDPEAALQKLEEIEKARALERASLKHRSTGKWARNKQVRAKYDKESRQALGQQLAISRDLTQKRARQESDSDPEIEVPSSTKKNDSNNPWVNNVKPTDEVTNFFTGYRKFWEEKNKNEQLKKQYENSNNLRNDENDNLDTANVESSAICKESNVKIDNIDDNVKSKSELNAEKKEIVYDADCDASKSESDDKKEVLKNSRNLSNDNSKKISNSNKASSDTDKVSFDKIESAKTNLENAIAQNDLGNKKKKNSRSIKKKSNQTLIATSSWIIEPAVQKDNSVQKRKYEETKQVGETSDKNKNKKQKPVNNDNKKIIKSPEKQQNKKVVSEKNTKISTKHNDNSNKNDVDKTICLDKIFEDLDDDMQKKIDEKVGNLKADYERIKKLPLNNEVTKKKTLKSDLSFKKKKVRPEIDEPLAEETARHKSDAKEVEEQITRLSGMQKDTPDKNSEQKSVEIDPNDFIEMKAKQLNTAIPDLMTIGEEAIDELEYADSQQMTIAEAFEDDDIVTEFRKNKQDEIDKNKPKDIDLTLPGWGSWGGLNMKVQKRRRRRLIIKLPEAAPRKDDKKELIILNEENDKKIREHLVNDLPFPFKRVQDFEASIRAPIGDTFVPEMAHRRLTLPGLVTKMGTVIEPMDENLLVDEKAKSMN